MFTVQHHLEDKLLAQICLECFAGYSKACLVLASRVGSNCTLNFLEVFDLKSPSSDICGIAPICSHPIAILLYIYWKIARIVAS